MQKANASLQYPLFFQREFPDLKTQQIQKLEKYVILLQDFNKKWNLVSRADIHHIWPHHILPSVIATKTIDFPAESRLLDIGTGAGLPGIPLKIVRPDLPVTLVDSSRKKTIFLRRVVDELNLANTNVFQLRLTGTGFPGASEEKFAVIVARAVTNIESLFLLTEPLLERGGAIILWKGKSDIPELEKSAEKLSFKFQIFSIPPRLFRFSDKFESLCFFRLSRS